MPETLPPFSGDDPTCPKCGNREASTAWWRFGRIDGEHVSLAYPDLWPERLHRECLRCSYGWDEAVVGQSPTIEPAPTVVDKVRHLRDVQGWNGTWNFSPYMLGLFNGLELALSVLEGEREPVYRDEPEDGYHCDRPTPDMSGPEFLPVPAGDDVEPTVDVYGEDTSWMIPLIQQYMNGERVTLPAGAVSYSASFNRSDPLESTFTVEREDGSTVTRKWSVKP
ncbi:hypothetical protein [Acrocarpospora sp. B8E8]|uniref:hypothetical protein n=1 Tax=Acrocarpospora sp. B8E8 TaxID=3153572 RepID=UPI00325EA748